MVTDSLTVYRLVADCQGGGPSCSEAEHSPHLELCGGDHPLDILTILMAPTANKLGRGKLQEKNNESYEVGGAAAISRRLTGPL